MRRLALVFSMAGIAVFLSSCDSGSSSDDGGAVSALTLPDRIDITNVEGSDAGARPNATVVGLYSDPDTDYTLAEKQSWSEDSEVLDMVNDILGVVKDTAYENFLNQGPYKALTRKVGDSESQGGSSATSTTVEELMEVILDVTRTSNSAPMIIKVWVYEPDGPNDMAMLIRGHFTVTEGVSDQYPYGALEAHFKGVILEEDGSEGEEVMNIAMKVDAEDGNVVIQCVQDEWAGGFTRATRLRVQANSTITTGNAYAYVSENGDPPVTTYFAFDEDFFKYADTPEGAATVLDKSSLFHRVYQYKLFEAVTGDLVTVNSGFPIQVEDGPNGYIGYWGLWVPYGSTVANGATVRRLDDDQTYTLVRVGGKLTRHTKATTTLGDLTGVELSKYSCDEGGCTDSIVVWDGSAFMLIGERDQETGQVTYYEEGDQTEVTFQEWEGGWCSALNAYLPLGSIEDPTDASTVTYHAEETIDPSDAENPLPTDLYYWGYDYDFSSEPADYSALQAAEQAYWGTPAVQKHYTFDPETLTLIAEDGTTAMDASSWDTEGTPYSNGFSIGPLLTDSWISQSDSWDEEVYYYWSTGPNEWNQFATLKSGSDYVHFDPPLQFDYTHLTENDLNGESTYNGKLFRLSYDGFSLQVPGAFDEARNEWLPSINLIDGVQLERETEGGTALYVVKATEEGIYMNEAADPSQADGLSIVAIDEPDLEYDASRLEDVGEVPSDVEVKVIKGELLEE